MPRFPSESAGRLARRLLSGQAFASLNTPQAWRMFWQIAGILLALALFWLIVAAILSFFPAWSIVFLTLILGCVWIYKDAQQKRREAWIESGCCGQCGYDLRASPAVCSECGRDVTLDEPTWKKVRRNFAAKLATEAKTSLPVIANQSTGLTAVLPPATSTVKRVIRRPREVDTEPIPLEPLPSEIPPPTNINSDGV